MPRLRISDYIEVGLWPVELVFSQRTSQHGRNLAGATELKPAVSCVSRRSNQLNYAPALPSFIIPLRSLRWSPLPCRTIWPCRDRATMTCNLLDFNGTNSPFLIL